MPQMNHIVALLGIIATLFFAEPTTAKERLVNNVDIKPIKGGTEPNKDASVLVVLLHGYTLNAESLKYVRNTLVKTEEDAKEEEVKKAMKDFKGANVLIPELPFSTFSMAPSSQITAELLFAIDKAWEKSIEREKPYKRIVFIGHSMGGLYARKIYVAACGEKEKAPFEKDLKEDLEWLGAKSLAKPRPWADKVDRIVLLAGMNRGWSISHHMSIPRAIIMKIGVAIGYILEWNYKRLPIIFSIKRGSSFITQLRLQWLAMREEANKVQFITENGLAKEVNKKHLGNALTIQLLGTIDDLVSPDDNIDLISGKDFLYLEVPESGHADVIVMDDSDSGKERKKKLIDAVMGKGERVSVDTLVVKKDVTDLVFIIHGIRDEGYWTKKIANRVKQEGKKLKPDWVIAAETSSYGYFPMLSFLHPRARQEKVEWLMDRYIEAMVTYPNVERFHFIGHSHGTYLIAKALEDYDSLQFDTIVFAGSVVHNEYNWNKYLGSRVKSVANFVATTDWVVAFFPKALQTLGVQDLGSGGHDGFKAAKTEKNFFQPEKYFIGGHSAALQEAMWDYIAKFTITGKLQDPPKELVKDEQTDWVYWGAKVAPLAWVIIAGLLAGILFIILYPLIKYEFREWIITTVVITYCLIIWTVLTEL